MKRAILRALVLTFAIITAICIANAAPALLESVTGADEDLRFLLAIGVLLLIILIVVSSISVTQTLKAWKRNKKKHK